MSKKPNYKKIIVFSFLVTLLFTFLDMIVHKFYEPLAIHYSYNYISGAEPLVNYMVGKIIFSTIIISVLILLAIKNRQLSQIKGYAKWQFIILGTIIALELGYWLNPYYTTQFHIYNMINHYITLGMSIYLLTRILKRNLNPL